MAESIKPDLKLVPSQGTSIFDDLDGLRRESKLTVRRKSVLVNVEVGKPQKDVYFRSHPDPTMRLDEATVVKDQDTYYFVVPGMRNHHKLAKQLRPVTLALVCIWPTNEALIWPVPILSEDRDVRAWKSQRAAYNLSLESWTQMAWHESDYVIETAEDFDMKIEPIWPDKTFGELLKLAFDGKIIDNEDHPYVRRLRGLLD